MAACDQLYAESPVDSTYETYGDTCAGRQPAGSGRYCVDAFPGGSAPTTTIPATTVPTTAVTAVPGPGLDVAAAKAGLARYFAAAPIDTFVAGGTCPVGAGQLLVTAMTANGLTPSTDQFDVTTIELDGTALGATTPQLFCMMAVPLETVPRGSVFVSDITGVTTFAELVAANGGHPIANPDPTNGGELGGNCYDYEGRYSCWVMWHRDGLVIDTYLTAAPGALTEQAAVGRSPHNSCRSTSPTSGRTSPRSGEVQPFDDQPRSGQRRCGGRRQPAMPRLRRLARSHFRRQPGVRGPAERRRRCRARRADGRSRSRSSTRRRARRRRARSAR